MLCLTHSVQSDGILLTDRHLRFKRYKTVEIPKSDDKNKQITLREQNCWETCALKNRMCQDLVAFNNNAESKICVGLKLTCKIQCLRIRKEYLH
jgi:hypothetical protein